MKSSRKNGTSCVKGDKLSRTDLWEGRVELKIDEVKLLRPTQSPDILTKQKSNKKMKITYSLFIIITTLSCNDKKHNIINKDDADINTDTLNATFYNALNSSEGDIYNSFHLEKENVIKKLKTISKSEANKLFLQYYNTNEEIISKINEEEQSILGKFYLDDAKSKSTIEEIGNKLSNYQLRFEEIGEGYVVILTIPSFYYDIFKSYVTDDYKDYIFLSFEDSKHLYSVDGGLAITFTELGERIIRWETFINKYPKFELLDEVKSTLINYRHDYIFGLDNTPTLERYFESQTEDNKKISYIVNDVNQKEFNSFLTKYPNSPTSKPIKLLLENHRKMQKESFFELIRNEINKQ